MDVGRGGMRSGGGGGGRAAKMLGGLFGERQTAGVQHLVLPPTDWQSNQLSNNLTLQVVSFFRGSFLARNSYRLGLSSIWEQWSGCLSLSLMQSDSYI